MVVVNWETTSLGCPVHGLEAAIHSLCFSVRVRVWSEIPMHVNKELNLTNTRIVWTGGRAGLRGNAMRRGSMRRNKYR